LGGFPHVSACTWVGKHHPRTGVGASLARPRGAAPLTISGVALLAICTLLGGYLGDLLGALLGVKANVGGVGIAMLLLIGSRFWLVRQGQFGPGLRLGVEFWGSIYIPIVVAMAAQQNVVAAVEGGPLVLLAGTGAVAICLAAVALVSRLGGPVETMDEIEARESMAQEPARVATGAPR
jgi:malonate transporter MadL subunit